MQSYSPCSLGVRAASEPLKEVFKPATLFHTSKELFNNRPQLLRTCGTSVGVLVILHSLNFCTFYMPPSQPRNKKYLSNGNFEILSLNDDELMNLPILEME